MIYILVTDFPDHWDRIKGHMTSYPLKMVKKVKSDQMQSGVDTIFIKKYNGCSDVENA